MAVVGADIGGGVKMCSHYKKEQQQLHSKHV